MSFVAKGEYIHLTNKRNAVFFILRLDIIRNDDSRHWVHKHMFEDTNNGAGKTWIQITFFFEGLGVCELSHGITWNMWFTLKLVFNFKKKWKCTDFIFSCSNYLSKNGDLGDVILLFYLHYSFCGTPNWSTWFAVTFYNTYQTTVKGLEKIDTTNGSRFPNSRQWNIHRHLHNCMFVRVDDAGNF